MKKYISIFIIISYSLFIFTPNLLFSQSISIKITKILHDKFAINKGSADGIEKGEYYIIIQKGKSIGKAKVVAVRNEVSALQIVSLNKNFNIKIGDTVIPDYTVDNQSEDLLMQVEENSFSKAKLASNTNYYLKGQQTAESEYSGGGAMIGGLISGFLLGLIGWGLGYAIMSGSDIKVPYHHLSNLNSQQTLEFTSGYKDTAKGKRNRNFHAGAAVGTLIIVLIVVNSYQQN